MKIMKLIVGLGNPGEKYQATRHNMGFRVLDELAETLNVSSFKTGFNSCYQKVNFGEETLILMKPQTYMNLSGTAVKEIVDYYKIDLDDILVISDDVSLDVGRIRLREKGTSGGQKGLENIIQCLGSTQFKRLKVGIGAPKGDMVSHVIGVVPEEDKEKIEEAIERAVDAIVYYLKTDFLHASSKFNTKVLD